MLQTKAIDINIQDSEGNTAGHLAALNQQKDIISLIEAHHKYDASVRNNGRKTADEVNPLNTTLNVMCERGTSGNVARMLLAGAKLITDENENTCFHRACDSHWHSVDKCKLLMEENPKLINIPNNILDVPLHKACRKSNSELTSYLLKLQNIEINAQNKYRHTPLHASVIGNRLENTRLMLSHQNCLVNAQDGQGNTAAHIAAVHQRLAPLGLLQSHPEYDSKLKNYRDETVGEIWNPAFAELISSKWIEQKTITTIFLGSITLINNYLYQFSYKHGIFIYNLDLDEMGHIATGDMERVRQVTELRDVGLVAAARNGLFHLPATTDDHGLYHATGEVYEQDRISSGNYVSVTTYNNTIYAALRDDSTSSTSIELYTHSDTWQRVNVIKVPCDGAHSVTLLVTSKAIYASCMDKHKLYVLSHIGAVLETIERHGSGGLDNFHLPNLCHSDSDGDLLLTEWFNNRLQVLSRDHQLSLVDIQPQVRHPSGAVYVSGRLYVTHQLLRGEWKLSMFRPQHT